MRLAASRTGNQTESLTRLAQRVREPNKLLLHAASLASGSLHARCEPGSGGAETNQALEVGDPEEGRGVLDPKERPEPSDAEPMV